MKKLITLTLAFCLLISGNVIGQQITNRVYVTYDSEAVTVAAVAIGFTSSKTLPTGTTYKAQLATFTIECVTTAPCPVRILATGTNPTASVGLIMNAGDIGTVYGTRDITRFKAIRTGANSASISVQYSY